MSRTIFIIAVVSLTFINYQLSFQLFSNYLSTITNDVKNLSLITVSCVVFIDLINKS